MAKINPAQLQALLASMGVEVVGSASADAKVATTAKARKVPANTAPTSYTVRNGSFDGSPTYKGQPMATFEAEGRRPVSMSHSKIKLVLAQADALRKIVG